MASEPHQKGQQDVTPFKAQSNALKGKVTNQTQALWHRLTGLRNFLSRLQDLWPGSPHQDDPAATWVAFLEEIGLTKLNAPRDKKYLQPILADYLPDDLIAAPAYAQIGAIVTAAAVAGAHIKEGDDKSLYPVAIGPGFQFDFRQHPILGITGAYSRYCKKKDSNSPVPALKKLETIMEYSRGQIKISRGILGEKEEETSLDLFQQSDRLFLRVLASKPKRQPGCFIPALYDIPDDFTPVLALFMASTPDFVPPMFPRSTLRGKVPLTILALNGKYWADLSPEMAGQSRDLDLPPSCDPPKWKHFRFPSREEESHDQAAKGSLESEKASDQTLKASEIKTFRIAKLGLQLSAIEDESMRRKRDHQRRRPVLEAYQELRIKQNHKTNKTEDDQEYNTITTAAPMSMRNQQTCRAETTRPDPANSTRKGTEDDGMQAAKVTEGDIVVLQMCARLMCNPALFLEWFWSTSHKERGKIRSRIHSQLMVVENWAKDRGQAYFNYRTGLLCNTTMVLLKLAMSVEKAHPETSETDWDLKSVDESYDQLFGTHHMWSSQSFARARHSETLQYLHELIDSFDLDANTSRIMKETDENFGLARKPLFWASLRRTNMPEDYKSVIERVQEKIRQHESQLSKILKPEELTSASYSNIYHLLERLAVIVAIQSAPNDDCGIWQTFHQDESIDTDTDDVVIYRYLLLALLFETAPDSGKMVQSGVWEQIVPIL